MLMPGLVCLAVASVSDIRTKTVPDIIWWIMAAEAFVCMFRSPGRLSAGTLLECLFVIYVQEHIMSRYYGMADSHAFSCCALIHSLTGPCLEMHILLMTVSLILLIIHQSVRHNIGPHGKLKAPVPFIPYICISFICVSILYVSKYSY